MKVLITGASGFIGNYIAKYLLNSFEIICTARKKKIDNLGCYVWYGDISNGLNLDKPVDLIIHCAAQSPSEGVKVIDYINSNIIATKEVLKYAVKNNIKKIIYLSGISVYGRPLKNIIDEDTHIVNPDNYGHTKFLAEQLIKDEGRITHSFVLRMPGVIGKNAKTPWLARIAVSLKNNKDVTIYNPDAQFNNILCIEDLAKFIKFLLELDNNLYYNCLNLASSEPLTIFETVKLLKDCLKSNSKIIIKKSNKISFMISYKKALQYGFKPKSVSEIILNNYNLN